MKLFEIKNVKSAGNKTNLSGGDLPNVYTSDSTKASKEPRKKKKDTYGGVGFHNTQNNNDSIAGEGDPAGDTGTATTTGGDTGGSVSGGGGDAGGGASGGAGGAGGGGGGA
jgi:hypothetical protein